MPRHTIGKFDLLINCIPLFRNHQHANTPSLLVTKGKEGGVRSFRGNRFCGLVNKGSFRELDRSFLSKDPFHTARLQLSIDCNWATRFRAFSFSTRQSGDNESCEIKYISFCIEQKEGMEMREIESAKIGMVFKRGHFTFRRFQSFFFFFFTRTLISEIL